MVKRPSSRVSGAQWELLLDFLEKNPNLARGYNNSSQGRRESQRLWEQIANMLNAQGYGVTKTPKEWSIYVSNFKCKLKKNVSTNNADASGTGGGPPLGSNLSEYEARFLAVLGPGFGQATPGVRVDPFPSQMASRMQKDRNKLVGITKKKNRRLFDYKNEDLNKAIEAIQTKKMGIREACRVYGVPKTTVHDRLSGKFSCNKKPKVGPDPVLGNEGEEKVKNWVLDMARCGFPIYKKDLLESVSKIIRDSGIKNPFKDGMPGDTWYHAFLRRHPEVSVREPEGINNARAAVTETRIRCWFNDLREYVKSLGALDIFEDPDRIFNGDETGFSLCPKSGKVLGPKGYKNLYMIKKNNEKENITVLVVFTASGKICPPVVVFPYVRPPKALIDSMPESWVLGRSESGWMRSDVFYEYVCNSFNTWVTQQGIKKPVILFIDGHKSHMTVSLSQFCEENGIILYALPANTTHILQPADVSVFKPLKQEWKKTIRNWQAREENINQTITKINFCKILNETLTTIDLKDAIVNGFRKCGLYPLNEDVVDYTKCVKDTIRKVRNSTQNKKALSAKDYDAATNVISFLRQNLLQHNIDTNVILSEIDKAKTKFLANRRSNSKTPRNSASSNLSNSILTKEIPIESHNVDAAVTPENLTFDEPHILPQTSHIHPSQNLDILTVDVITDATLQHCVADENIENVSFPEAGSFVSLSNISLMPFDEMEISHNTNSPLTNPSGPESHCRTFMASADVHEQPIAVLKDIPLTCSFDDAFARHLQFPEPPTPKEKIKGPKLPSAISSTSWREYYRKKEEDKENLVIEKKRKQLLRAELKERKAKEKANKVPRKKKAVQKNTFKKSALQCGECCGDLFSDAEEDSEKNIGCDKCVRWYHLKCTVLNDVPYSEAASMDYKCNFCN